MGVPIPDNKMMVGVSTDYDEMLEEYNDELSQKTIAQQKAKVRTYNALAAAGDPIPPDLKAEVEAARSGGADRQQEDPQVEHLRVDPQAGVDLRVAVAQQGCHTCRVGLRNAIATGRYATARPRWYWWNTSGGGPPPGAGTPAGPAGKLLPVSNA